MAENVNDVYNFSAMDDDEVYDVVVQHLREYPEVDAGWIDVSVKDGLVTLSGRVGTDGERQVAEKLVAEVLGIERYANELVVSEAHRGEAPMAADEAVASDLEVDDQLGEDERNQSDTAGHLEQNLETDTYGTHDLGTSIEDGTPYVPPDRPIPDGYDSHENH